MFDLSEQLAQRGHDVSELTLDPPNADIVHPEQSQLVSHITSLSIGSNHALWLNKQQIARAKEKLSKASVLHIHGMWSPHMVHLAEIAIGMGIPYVVTVHGMLDEVCLRKGWLKKRVFMRLCGNRFLARAQRVITSSLGEQAQVRRWLREPNSIVLPPAMDLDAYIDLPNPDIAADRFDLDRRQCPVILFLSRLHPKKGIEHLIDAARILSDRGTHCTVVIAGTGDPAYEAALRKRVASCDLQDMIHFVGMVDGELKRSLYACATVFALPTSQENFGLVLTESCACGTPVITTRGVDIWQELSAAGAAVIVEQSGQGFADAICSMIADPKQSELMGQKGRDWVLNTFAIPTVLPQYEQMYSDIIGPNTQKAIKNACV
ncbi:MAG: glycosyltransferase [Phycisphaeraceae bacterium]|nr:glycosyltransferase [Phycisphaerales bacterium]MCB9860400.1 glycosyltransferase [Phycisphaeraceae bacterium]